MVVKYKARLVAQGFSHREGVDFHETFAPVATFTTIGTLIAIAAREGYMLKQADVDSAFIQPGLPVGESVYMQPRAYMKDMPEFSGKILFLLKTLFGLKQSERAWYGKVHTDLVTLGYKCTRTDACVYVKELPVGRFTYSYLALCVDDILFCGPLDSEFTLVKDHLGHLYGIKDLGDAEFILGIQISRDTSGIFSLLGNAPTWRLYLHNLG